MAGIFGRIKQKLSRAGSKMEKYQEAITFAEAGESEYAMETMAEQREEQEPTKLLVMGRESTFSKEIIDYALEMAQRVGNPTQLWKTYAVLGELCEAEGRSDDARGAYDDAISVIKKIADGLKNRPFKETLLGSQQVKDIRQK